MFLDIYEMQFTLNISANQSWCESSDNNELHQNQMADPKVAAEYNDYWNNLDTTGDDIDTLPDLPEV